MRNVVTIDINCDVGEGVGNEPELMPLLSSCNIACGGHAGTIQSITEVVTLAKKHNVKMGAHPSYPDKANFGRMSLNLSEEELSASIREQLDRIAQIVLECSVSLNHIKPHGALYNDCAKDIELAKTFLRAISPYKESCILYVPTGKAIGELAQEAGFRIKNEAFADRNYNPDLSLVSRSLTNAVIESPESVLEHLLNMVQNNEVVTVEGIKMSMEAETFCVHGDTENALQILTYLSAELPNYNVRIAK